MTSLLTILAKKLVVWTPRLFWLFAILLILSIPIFGPKLWPIPINNTLATLLEQGTKQEKVDNLIHESFGSIDEILILAYHDENNMFSVPNLRLVASLTDAIQDVKGVKDCFSLANTPFFRNTEQDGDSVLAVAPLLDNIPNDIAGLKQLEIDAKTNVLYQNNIISKDAKTVAFNIILEGKLAPAKKELVVQKIRALYGKLKSSCTGSFYFTGMHVFMETTGVQMQRDVIQFSVVSMLLLMVALFVVFRSASMVLIALLPAGIANWLLFLSLYALGKTLSISTTPVPAITTGLSIAYVLHFLTAKREGKLEDSVEAGHIFTGNLLSVLTTMIGFFSLYLNPIPTLKDFGLFAGLGTFFAFVSVTFISFPLLKMISHTPKKEFGDWAKAGMETIFISYRRFVVGISLVILISGAFLFRMEVQTDYYKYYLRNAPMTTAVNFVNSHIGGQYPIVIELDSGVDEGAYEFQMLDFVKNIKEYCQKLEGVDKVISYLDLLNDGHRGFAGEPEAGWYKSRAKVGQIAMIVRDASPEIDAYYIDSSAQKTLLFIRTNHINSTNFIDINQAIREFIAKHAPAEITCRVGGTYLRCVQSANRMALSQFFGTFAAIIVLFVVAFAAIPKPKLILMAFVVNLLPILGIYGLLGILGETLNMGTATIAAIAVGIGMDDTMHFLARFITGMEQSGNPVASARYVIHTSGVSMVLTSFMVAITFLSLSLSIIKPIAQLGLFTGVTMALCLLADLFLLPVLLTWNSDLTEKVDHQMISEE